jgi:hypothetical protein
MPLLSSRSVKYSHIPRYGTERSFASKANTELLQKTFRPCFQELHGFIEDTTCDHSGDSSVRSFNLAMNALPQIFALEVSGKFHWNRNWKPTSALLGHVKSHPQGQLEITHVWRFQERRS